VKDGRSGPSGPWTVPNFVTIARLAILPFFLIAVSDGRHALALVLFLVGAVSDGLDGYLARRFSMSSTLGAYLDPLADKLLLMSSYFVMSVPSFPAVVHVPRWLMFLVLSRDALILVIAALMFMTIGLRRFPPTIAGKTTAFVQFVTIFCVLCANVWTEPDWFVLVPFGATAAGTIISGCDYIFRASRAAAEHETARTGA
jgi:cardiolipin synthase (CMP-forming)